MSIFFKNKLTEEETVVLEKLHKFEMKHFKYDSMSRSALNGKSVNIYFSYHDCMWLKFTLNERKELIEVYFQILADFSYTINPNRTKHTKKVFEEIWKKYMNHYKLKIRLLFA